jgi:hypothetical protein
MLITTIFFFTAVLAVLWVRGIDKMSKEHSNYKGEDLI